jgi:hypothetical protein
MLMKPIRQRHAVQSGGSAKPVAEMEEALDDGQR